METVHEHVQYVNPAQVHQPNTTRMEMKLTRDVHLYPQDLQATLKSCLHEEVFTDIYLYCRRQPHHPLDLHNTGGWISVKANQSVLVAVSPFMKRILASTSSSDSRVVMDGFSYEEVYSLVQYAYTGQIDSHLQAVVDLQRIIDTFELKFVSEIGQSEAEEEDVSEGEGTEWTTSKECSKDDQRQHHNKFRTKTVPKRQSSSDAEQRPNEGSSPADRTCDFCGKYFARPALMLNHRRIHTGEKPFVCTICNKKYREKSHLTRHQRSHNDNTKPFRCESCNKSFANHFYLTQHTLTHSGYKRLLCSTCGYQCFQASDLKKHMRTHTGEKPYVCPVQLCGKAFTQKVSCVKHQQALHKTVDIETLESLPTFEADML